MTGGARGWASRQDWIPGAGTSWVRDTLKDESTGAATAESAGGSARACRLHHAQWPDCAECPASGACSWISPVPVSIHRIPAAVQISRIGLASPFTLAACDQAGMIADTSIASAASQFQARENL